MEQSKLRVDYLANHKDYKVVQHEDMYHFNTDTCLLGEFIKINKDEKVLDVGTNNGALLVYIIKKGGIATGIDINDQAIEVAKLTLKENDLKASLIVNDFTNYQSDERYDVIISNPPYFDSKDDFERNNNINKSLARHEGTLNLESLIKSIKNNLKETGRIYLVYRPVRFEKLEKELNKNNLFINYYQMVYDYRKKEPKSVLLEASFNSNSKIQLEDMIIGR